MPEWTANAQLAIDAIYRRQTAGIPSWMLHIMQHSYIERLAGVGEGDYARDPEKVYLAMQRNVGTCMIDQFIPTNPLTMGDQGYDNDEKGATTGAERIVRDGIKIKSPESVIEHLQRIVFPQIQQDIRAFDTRRRTREIIDEERRVQNVFGTAILKAGYAFVMFPVLRYTQYGYENYFMAYALYPDIIERDFALQADLAVLNNRAAAAAFRLGHLPALYRLDHDMADSRGTLVNIGSLEQIWFPHFTRTIKPLIDAGVTLIWHCDGNLMEMVPRLIDAGVAGFQGFQYEDGMDYERICKMKTRQGEELFIIAGVSVTRTLPHGSPMDVRREIDWLVENGPKTGLMLGASSSIAPGVPFENIVALVKGLAYYRMPGRR